MEPPPPRSQGSCGSTGSVAGGGFGDGKAAVPPQIPFFPGAAAAGNKSGMTRGAAGAARVPKGVPWVGGILGMFAGIWGFWDAGMGPERRENPKNPKGKAQRAARGGELIPGGRRERGGGMGWKRRIPGQGGDPRTGMGSQNGDGDGKEGSQCRWDGILAQGWDPSTRILAHGHDPTSSHHPKPVPSPGRFHNPGILWDAAFPRDPAWSRAGRAVWDPRPCQIPTAPIPWPQTPGEPLWDHHKPHKSLESQGKDPESRIPIP